MPIDQQGEGSLDLLVARIRQMSIDRRRLVASGGAGGLMAIGGKMLTSAQATPPSTSSGSEHNGHSLDPSGVFPMPMVVGEVDHVANGFDPTEILTDFDGGSVSKLPSGQTLREYTVTALNKEIEIVPGLHFPAWTYNGRVPGPTFRATEGDRIRIEFINGGDHPHSMHFHGIHPGTMDGVFDAASGLILPGETFVYEFDAEPFGMHLYHCHTPPLAAHIARGLYGAFIVDPKDGWDPVDHEYVMVMHGYSVDFDIEGNTFYAVNGIPFHYDLHLNPIRFKTGETVRIFLANLLEYDPINSFHLHANFFNYYPTGTSRTPAEFTDTIAQMQGQRGILEFTYKFPGRYMFHAHKSEFAELGWTGVFVVED